MANAPAKIAGVMEPGTKRLHVGVRAAEKNRVATNTFANLIANISIQKYQEILQCNHNNNNLKFQQTVLSTFVLRYKDPNEVNKYAFKVVALGVGTKFLSKANIEKDINGTCVKDLHAEILAQRSFKLFLYRQVLDYCENKETLMFEKIPETIGYCAKGGEDNTSNTNNNIKVKQRQLCKLKKDVSIHFYTSSQPCGNACLKKFAKSSKPKFQCLPINILPTDVHSKKQFSALDKGEIAFLLKGSSSVLNQDNNKNSNTLEVQINGTHQVYENEGNRSYVHTCSDKILKWNVCGLQGTLLNHFIRDIVYINTCTFGRKFGKPFNERALCCRLQNIDFVNKTNNRYTLNHPPMLCTSIKFDNTVYSDTSKQQATFEETNCLYWCYNDPYPTVLNGSTGTLIHHGQKNSNDDNNPDRNECYYSNISKRGLAHMFETVSKKWILSTNYNECNGDINVAYEYNSLKKVGRAHYHHICKKLFYNGYNKKVKAVKGDDNSIRRGTGTWVNSPNVKLKVVVPIEMKDVLL